MIARIINDTINAYDQEHVACRIPKASEIPRRTAQLQRL